MQSRAVLSNAQHPEYGVVTIPFPIPAEQYDRSGVYKISMVRMSILADTLTNLRMYGSIRRLYRNVQVR